MLSPSHRASLLNQIRSTAVSLSPDSKCTSSLRWKRPVQHWASGRARPQFKASPKGSGLFQCNFRYQRGFATGISAEADIYFPEDTIYALSTAPGRAGIAIIRISGPACLDVYQSLCPGKPLPKPRNATVRTLLDTHAPSNPNILDSNAIVLYFPGPKSVTGEDVLELHVHGGPATVKAILSAIPKCSSPSSSSLSSPPNTIRYAEPGEFTKRAFFNNRLDLAQVESLSDSLAAETEQQRRAAVRGNSGSLGRTYDSWRETLLSARGELEALIDFSEDQHFDESPAELLGNVTGQVRQILDGIDRHEAASSRGELLRSGIRIALLGPANVGKSSLMNLVVGREASIVSAEAGTTRDIVEVNLDIRGYLCSFADTAGFRGTRATTTSPDDNFPQSRRINNSPVGAVEEEGIRRAKRKALESDIIVVLASVEPNPDYDPSTSCGSNSSSMSKIVYDEETLRLAASAQASLLVVNKSDVVDEPHLTKLLDEFRNKVGRLSYSSSSPEMKQHTNILTISCKAAQKQTLPNRIPSNVDEGGIHAFTDKLVDTFANMTHLPVDMQDLLGVTERQRQLLAQCRDWLEEYMAVACSEAGDTAEGDAHDIVLAAEHLRFAGDALAKITGRGGFGDVEEVLGVVFEK